MGILGRGGGKETSNNMLLSFMNVLMKTPPTRDVEAGKRCGGVIQVMRTSVSRLNNVLQMWYVTLNCMYWGLFKNKKLWINKLTVFHLLALLAVNGWLRVCDRNPDIQWKAWILFRNHGAFFLQKSNTAWVVILYKWLLQTQLATSVYLWMTDVWFMCCCP